MADFRYVGSELELFSAATVWKTYFRHHIAPYLGADVLEVGAGLGGTTRLLCPSGHRQGTWVCLEPDPEMARSLAVKIEDAELPSSCQIVLGTLDELPTDARFDSVLYIDVLEHIADDRDEMLRAADRLKPAGHLVVLAPAHPWLFSPFDHAIGHHRRYTRKALQALAPESLVEVRSIYLDSVGLLASMANRIFLRQSLPGPQQIAFWDKVLVRGSRLADPLMGYSLGKSVLCVWKRTALV
jgi:SAM-dependent methyltransferase